MVPPPAPLVIQAGQTSQTQLSPTGKTKICGNLFYDIISMRNVIMLYSAHRFKELSCLYLFTKQSRKDISLVRINCIYICLSCHTVQTAHCDSSITNTCQLGKYSSIFDHYT